MKYFIIVGMLLVSATAYAQFNGCPPGWCNLSASGSAPSVGDAALLVNNTDGALLVDNTNYACLVSGSC